MDITVVADKLEMPLPSGAKQSFPKNWSGSVPDDFGADALKAGKAILTATVQSTEFSNEQKAILKAAADQILAQQAALTAAQQTTPPPAVEAINPETGEPLEDMTVAQLVELAETLEIEGGKKLKKAELIAAIVAALTALAATPPAA